MSLAFSNFLPAETAVALVIGANLGSAINPLLEGGGFSHPKAMRLPLGNLMNRIVGCAVVLPMLHQIASWMSAIDPNPVRMVADFHTLFNFVLATVFIAPLPLYARLIEWLLPEPPTKLDPSAPIYLDPAALATPSLALVCAARETLHMGDLIETMLRKSMDAFTTDDRKLVSEIERMDNDVDRLHEAIKLYVTRITRESLDDQDSRRAMEIISCAINLEHVGDIIDKNLMELAAKKIKNRLSFSEMGSAELRQFHRSVLDNLKLAFGVFLSGDIKVARQLVEQKTVIRDMERAAAESHFARLRDGVTASVETSSLHLDILRDLKRIFSHICSIAYPVLEASGELQPSRLRSYGASVAAQAGETPR
jgi:phosphate:Na+ symporter